VWPSPARLRGGLKLGQRNVGVVNPHGIEEALDMGLSERVAEVEGKEGQGNV